MSDELKPCPFCGANDAVETDMEGMRRTVYFVSCNKCGAAGPSRVYPDHSQPLTEADLWNRRATAPEPAPGDLPAVTGNEWTRFIPRAAAFFRDNGDVKLETEINDLACLLYQVARAGLPAPEPAPGDRESQGAFIDDPIREGPPMDLFKRACDWIENIDIQYGPSPHSLAAEFAKVREEQKEMDAKIADGMIDRNDAGKIDHDDIGSITALDIRDAIRRGEP